MVWTDEDSKDVMKKTLGTLLAAALIAVVSKAYNLLTIQMTVLLATLIAVIFVALVLIRWRASTGGRPQTQGPGADGETGQAAQSTANPPAIDHSEYGAPVTPSPETQPVRYPDDQKARKKAAKDELKRAKKEAKR